MAARKNLCFADYFKLRLVGINVGMLLGIIDLLSGVR